jgi:hypothetical protein
LPVNLGIANNAEVPVLFPAWSDTALRMGLAGLALAVPGIFVLPIIYVRTPYNLERQVEVVQPVQFDHRHHVQDDGIPCLYCHDLVDNAPNAGIPATEVCMGCHSQIWNQSPLLQVVRDSFFSGQPIPWKRVHHVPDFVFFNHAVHVNNGVDCVRCHGNVSAMPLDRKVAPFTMGWCLDCHRQQPEEFPGRRAEKLAALQPVPSLITCTACHR